MYRLSLEPDGPEIARLPLGFDVGDREDGSLRV